MEKLFFSAVSIIGSLVLTEITCRSFTGKWMRKLEDPLTVQNFFIVFIILSASSVVYIFTR